MKQDVKQVNISFRRDTGYYAWISDYSEDSYCGLLIDTVYCSGPDDTTSWKYFVGTEGQCLIFKGLYNLYGDEAALDYERHLHEWAYHHFCWLHGWL